MPTSSIDGMGRIYDVLGGICRGIWFVRTGAVKGGWRNPTQLPAKERGTEIRNQIPMITIIVVNGTAPEDSFAQRKRSRRKKVPNTMPGTRTGVSPMLSFHRSPPKDFYTLAETYPPINPRTVYKRIIIVPSDPRFEGERNPRRAKAIVNPVMTNS